MGLKLSASECNANLLEVSPIVEMTNPRLKNRVQRTENQRVGASLVGAQKVESGNWKDEI